MQLAETTNPEARLYLDNDVYAVDSDDELEDHVELDAGVRPAETEADLIAAAAYPGSVFLVPMIAIKPIDGNHDGMFVGTREAACRICHTPAHAVASEIQEAKASHAEILAAFGVEWDPTIRL